MTKQEQIQTINKLVEATKELNGEHQDGWQEEIDKGEQLLQYLEQQTQPPSTIEEVTKPLHWLYDRLGIDKNVTHNDSSKAFNIRQCAQYISECTKYLQSTKQ